jgi:hypothetical protein
MSQKNVIQCDICHAQGVAEGNVILTVLGQRDGLIRSHVADAKQFDVCDTCASGLGEWIEAQRKPKPAIDPAPVQIAASVAEHSVTPPPNAESHHADA